MTFAGCILPALMIGRSPSKVYASPVILSTASGVTLFVSPLMLVQARQLVDNLTRKQLMGSALLVCAIFLYLRTFGFPCPRFLLRLITPAAVLCHLVRVFQIPAFRRRVVEQRLGLFLPLLHLGRELITVRVYLCHVGQRLHPQDRLPVIPHRQVSQWRRSH